MNKSKLALIVLSLSVMFFSGCAHKISMTPELEDIRKIEITDKIDINVGYYISDDLRKLEVITPGGGGDDVKYTPYSDTEGALNTILSKKFTRVYYIKSLKDTQYIKKNNILYIFTPKIITDSSSDSFMLWPPSNFKVDLTCTAMDSEGTKVWEETVHAEGNAITEEFIKDFSITAKIATESSFKKMLLKLNDFKDNK